MSLLRELPREVGILLKECRLAGCCVRTACEDTVVLVEADFGATHDWVGFSKHGSSWAVWGMTYDRIVEEEELISWLESQMRVWD